jgi:hypothetical protein
MFIEATMKLRTASESVGWMNSVGPLTVSPHFPKPAIQPPAKKDDSGNGVAAQQSKSKD